MGKCLFLGLLMFIHFDFASGQSAGQPLYVSQFERQKHKTDSVVNIHCTLWVQKVMRCSISNIVFKSSSHCFVHPKEFRDNSKMKGVKRHIWWYNNDATYRNTEWWESINLPLPDCRNLPEFPTTAQVRQRDGSGLKSTVGEGMTLNISAITSSRVLSLPDRWRRCVEMEDEHNWSYMWHRGKTLILKWTARPWRIISENLQFSCEPFLIFFLFLNCSVKLFEVFVVWYNMVMINE